MRTTQYWTITILGMAILAGAGCQRLMNQNAAIQKAIQDHLGSRSDLAMDKMIMEVQAVKVEGEKAQAEVVFRTANDPAMRMSYHYELHREDGTWKVDSGRPSASQTPHPDMGQSESPQLNLPPDHPPIGQTMPPAGGDSAAAPPMGESHPPQPKPPAPGK